MGYPPAGELPVLDRQFRERRLGPLSLYRRVNRLSG
jgi:hypothetical protein